MIKLWSIKIFINFFFFLNLFIYNINNTFNDNNYIIKSYFDNVMRFVDDDFELTEEVW